MIEASGASDPGCVRANNEDYYLVEPSLGLYLVADGMGGAQAGEHASRLAVETVRDIIRNNPEIRNNPGIRSNPDGAIPDQLVDAFIEANRRVMQAAEADPRLEGMGTTLVAALQRGDDLVIASVGDSRAYLFEQGRLQQLTEDQTWVNEVGRRLGLEEGMLKNHPMRHVLTMAVGVSDQLRVHSYQLKPSPGVQLLLCTDGLHGVASQEQIEKALASDASLEAKCGQLIASARAQGGPDNITAVLLRTS
jgi:serine/threonine protein phosphatase PrpC